MLRRLTHAVARLLPSELRVEYAGEIARDIDRRFRDGRRFSTLIDIAGAVLRERRATVRSHMFQDLRFALRMIRHRPAFSAAVVIILGLGIGSTTAIVSLAQATLLRPVDAVHADRLVEVRGSLNYPFFRAMQQTTDVAEAVLAYGSLREGASLNRGGTTQRVGAALVSGNYFDALGVRAAAGRLLTPADDVTGGVPAVVISHRLWSSAFGRSREVIGAAVEINRRPAVIVGVAAEGFKGLSLSNVPDVWMPVAFTPTLATGFIGRPAALDGGMTWLRVVVRLKPETTFGQASARFTALYASLYPPKAGNTREPFVLDPAIATAVTRNARGDLRTFVQLLVAVAAALLLLGCSNVANLLLARGAARGHEIAVRTALGAGRLRLMSQLMIESVVLAALGGVAGIFVAAAALRAVGEYRLPGDVTISDLGLGIDAVTLTTSALLALAATLLFGPLPAWLATRRDVRSSLSAGGRGSTRLPLGRLLVAGQIALCVTLVGGGLLFARGLQRALSVDLGYDPAGVAMTTADPALERLKPAEVDAYITNTLDRLRSDPNVKAAGASVFRPMRGGMSTSVYIDGRPGEELNTAAHVVSEGLMEAMGLRLVKGRTLAFEDRHATPHRVVVSETAARTFWPNRDPLGARLRFDNGPQGIPYEVVGVVADARYGSITPEPQPFVYISIFDPGLPGFRSQITFFARAAGDPLPLVPRIREAAHSADARVPLSLAMTMEEHVASVLMPQRLGLVLLMVFAAAGLTLSAAGVYAIAAYHVSMRTREIGIRMALGAARLRVVKDVLRDGAVPIAAGVAAGVGLQLWASKFAVAFVYGLNVREPLQVLGAAFIVVIAAAAALTLPARRAAGVDPVIALRDA